MPMLVGPDHEPMDVIEGHGLVSAVCVPEAFHNNLIENKAYSVLVDVTPGSTDDDFFYLKNNDELTLVIYKIEGWCTDANQEIKVLLGATSAGTDAGDDLTPVNMNAGAISQPADIDCTQDATDLAIAGGSVISLLKFPTTALERETFHFQSGIIVPKNQRLHMEAALAGLINLNIYFYFTKNTHRHVH